MRHCLCPAEYDLILTPSNVGLPGAKSSLHIRIEAAPTIPPSPNTSPATMATCIYIVEDHEVMRRALVDFLENISDFQVSGAAATAEEALDRIYDAAVDVALVDSR